MANNIITRRIKQLEAEKRELLTKKKSERNGRLKIVNDVISRLKRWSREESVRMKGKVRDVEYYKKITEGFKATITEEYSETIDHHQMNLDNAKERMKIDEKSPETTPKNVLNINKAIEAFKEISEANPGWVKKCHFVML
jgi:hypothetical protein